jgi:phosphatidylethanolamine-binding protein (PEBP) family uncharacterized protein
MTDTVICRLKVIIAVCICAIFVGCGSGASGNQSSADQNTGNNSANGSTAHSNGTSALTFALTSDAGENSGTLPAEYTCDSAGNTIALSWANVPAGTKEFALMMTTLPGDGTTKWNWVMYGIPATVTSLTKNSSGIGTLGTGSRGTAMAYDPPCSQGPGAKLYTFTIYALSASPTLPASSSQVTGEVLTSVISSLKLGTATLNLNYSRP